MKKFLAFSFCVAVALGLSNPLSAQAQAASGIKGICGFGSARLFNLLVRQKVIDQYTAAGHKNVFAFVVIKAGKIVSQPVTLANVTGVSDVKLKAGTAGGTEIVTTADPVEVGCTVELPVTIKVSYTPADGTARKTVTDTQTMKFQGFFK